MESVECIRCGARFVTDGHKGCKVCNSGGSELEKERAKSRKLLEALYKIEETRGAKCQELKCTCVFDVATFAIAEYGEGE